jgi:hypothetical protein
MTVLYYIYLCYILVGANVAKLLELISTLLLIRIPFFWDVKLSVGNQIPTFRGDVVA